MQYGYGEIWFRPGLDLRRRALVEVAAFTALKLDGQVKKFGQSALNMGLSRTEVIEAVIQTAPFSGFAPAPNALGGLSEALGKAERDLSVLALTLAPTPPQCADASSRKGRAWTASSAPTIFRRSRPARPALGPAIAAASRRDRAHAPHSRAAAVGAARAPALPPAAAALGRRRARWMPGIYIEAIEEVARHDASVGWNLFVANSSALIAPFLAPEWRAQSSPIRARSSPGVRPMHARAGRAGGYRITGRWDFASGCRQANWMGAHCHVEEAGRHAAPEPLRPAGACARCCFPSSRRRCSTPGTPSACAARLRLLQVDDVFVPEAFQRHARGSGAAPRARAALCLHHAGTLCGWRGRRRARHRAGHARRIRRLGAAQDAARSGRLADNADVQADVARAEARLGSARAYLLETLATSMRAPTTWRRSDVADRARVRLGCANAIHAAIEVADFAYKAAGWMRSFPAPVRAPLPRHAHALAADPGARRPLRSGRPDPAGRHARRCFFRAAPDRQLSSAGVAKDLCRSHRHRCLLRRMIHIRPPP